MGIGTILKTRSLVKRATFVKDLTTMLLTSKGDYQLNILLLHHSTILKHLPGCSKYINFYAFLAHTIIWMYNYYIVFLCGTSIRGMAQKILTIQWLLIMNYIKYYARYLLLEI